MLNIYLNIKKISGVLLGIVYASSLTAQNLPGNSTRPGATPVIPQSAYTNGTINYVRAWEPSMPTTDTAIVTAGSRTVAEVKQTTQYFDGLGRPLQTVSKKISPQGVDMVTPVIYDPFGREQFKYLPYAQQSGNTNDGKFKTDPFNSQQTFYQNAVLNPGVKGESIFYSQVEYEASPLNRVLKTYSPGNNWASSGGNRPVIQDYQVNTAGDGVRVWDMPATGITPVSTRSYDPGQLYKNVSTDERGYRVVAFKDKEGRAVMNRVELGSQVADGHNNWLCTYYVYDDLGNLRCVIPPKAVELIKSNWTLTPDVVKELCFLYRYDGRNRMIVKKIPGADSTELVYDIRDRLVFSRDGNLRTGTTPQWLVTFYDALNRPSMTALYNSGATKDALQTSMNTAANSQTIGYTFPGIADLVVATHDRPVYQATKSISIESGFDSGTNGVFDALIDPNTTEGQTTITATNPLPGISSNDLTPLTYTYYNDYSFAGAQSYQSGDFGKPQAGSNPYAELLTGISNMTSGMVTGTKVRVLGTDKWLTTTTYYTDKGRVAQVIADNVGGGQDVVTNLYNFNGKLLSNYLRHKNPRSGATPQTMVLTMLAYDDAGRLTQVTKQLNDDASTQRLIAANTYDELGQLKNKSLGVIGSTPLETLNYEYNIRGSLTGINKGFVNTAGSTGNWFGQELNYDDGFQQNQYNGNIAGIKWKSKSDGISRAYGYSYDEANRIKIADFSQQNSGSTTWTNDKMDFSVSGLTYDANGNIGTMNQKGMKGVTSATIDQLTYTYLPSSNKLQGVADQANDPSSTLGDFKEINGTGNNDYLYDLNGNLTSDANKNITAISYNHLNLPLNITISGKGAIQYKYDAAGNKLEKVVTDNTITPAKITTTDYIGGFVYQNDTLQFAGHEEGRIRATYKTGQPIAYVYDYFVKDHLGNVRMILTEQSDFSMYAATMETSKAATENALFSNIEATRVNKPVGYPQDNSAGDNAFVAKLNVNSGGNKIGPSLVLRVMAGDTVQISAKAFYKSLSPQDTKQAAPIEDMIASLANVFATSTNQGSVHASSTNGQQSPFSSNFTNNDYQRLKDKDPNQNKTDKPKAYLNFVLFDDQFNLVDNNSGVKQVQGDPDNLQSLATDKMPITKSGFLYVYTSNESPQDVFFDNIILGQSTGPILEETHYYPFGLTMAGISSNALKGANYPENRKKYNGIEYTNELDLDIYDAQLRNLDPQIGRWNQIDPKMEKMEMWSPYASNYDNPIRYNDFLGDEPGPGDPEKQYGLVTGREYTLTTPSGFGSSLKYAAQYAAGIVNEFVAGVNQNLNPVYAAGNGAQALVTGKDLQTGHAMSGVDASISILSSIPIGKAFQIGGKLLTSAEGMVARMGEQATGNSLQGAVAKEGVLQSQVLEYAKTNGIYSGQKSLNSISIVGNYLTQMKEGVFNTEQGAAGFIDKGKTIITDGNHRMNAAIQYTLETGDNKFVQSLIQNGNFTHANPAQYGVKVYNLPVKPIK
ncbi:RHS repeat-associated protein [Chitinophaga niastensis]|uniref:RHS repeat-associated protein n=1 Tax=Chitinophaga niastensis TaxID=536980 RepID=A0A2P8HMH6_CHINA|nr:DUF6443 domain-containing protein [Chitinophaga niastensis]PSL47422.1 RHS repeat-associated protein [Chitinophaga niastensis]